MTYYHEWMSKFPSVFPAVSETGRCHDVDSQPVFGTASIMFQTRPRFTRAEKGAG